MTEMAAANRRPAHQDVRARSLTVEHALYGLILLGGIGMRFIALGAEPLAPLEAVQAWPAWLAASAGQAPGAPQPVSALLYGLQSSTFFVAGANDWLVRLWPALLGTAVVVLPYFWRPWLGRIAALVLALLFAFDPWLVAVSRAGDGAGLALFLGLFTLMALVQWQFASTPFAARRWERAGAAGAGLLLASGVQSWNWLPVLLLFAGIVLWPAYRDRRTQPLHRSTLAWFGVALIVGAGGLLLRPEAFAAIGASLSGWFAQFGSAEASAPGPGWVLLRLGVDQPFLTIFGPLGVVLLWAAGNRAAGGYRLPLFVSLWLVWAALLLALPGQTPFTLPLLGIPLAIAAASAVGYIAGLSLEDVSGMELVVLLAVATVLVISGVIWLAALVENQSFNEQLLVTALILLGLTVAIWIVSGVWAGWRPACKLAGLFFAGLFLAMTLRSSWLLNHVGGLMKPDGFWNTVTLAGVRDMVEDIERLSVIRAGDPQEAAVQVVMGAQPDPVLGWHLRYMRNLEWTLSPDVPLPGSNIDPALLGQAGRPLVVAPPGFQNDPALAGYFGRDYLVAARWEPSRLPALSDVVEKNSEGLPADELARLRSQQQWQQSMRPRLEWLFYRNITAPPETATISLWAPRLEP